MASAPPRALPSTQDDLNAIVRTAAAAVGTRDLVYSAMLVPTGAYLHIHRDYANRAAVVLDACGYTATLIRDGHLLISGVVDRASLLEAEINRLEAERRSLDETTTA